METIELLSCPFCGRQPEPTKVGFQFMCECRDPGGELFGDSGRDWYEAAEKWNAIAKTIKRQMTGCRGCCGPRK